MTHLTGYSFTIMVEENGHTPPVQSMQLEDTCMYLTYMYNSSLINPVIQLQTQKHD